MRIIEVEVNIGIDVLVIDFLRRVPLVGGLVEDVFDVVGLVSVVGKCAWDCVLLAVVHGEEAQRVLVHEAGSIDLGLNLVDGTVDVQRYEAGVIYNWFHDWFFRASGKQNRQCRTQYEKS